jgi:Protein of unknown function (DUF2480)
MKSEIINRVAESSLIQIDLEDWYDPAELMNFDIATYLYMGLVLKELDFRSALKQIDWTSFQGKHLAIHCSADAIVPTWSFMLVATWAAPFAKSIVFGTKDKIIEILFERVIENLDLSIYKDQKVIVKGCSKYPVPVSAYISITSKLAPIVQSLMFGEPCSNVPLYKRKKQVSSDN